MGDQIEKNGWAGHVAHMGGGGRGEVYTGFWWVNLCKRDHLGDPGLLSEDIKMDLQEVGWEGTNLAQDRDR